ncbi:MAG: glutamine amidotransferase [Anaerolineae bacterium]|nr:glutamine amidotransferase [Anaerolineae bacterium]MCQ3977132.1 glutamine amidotransferase [Anaerolineae bacterium]
MCGIGGVKLARSGPIGPHLVNMMTALRHRGADSTGFALYGPYRTDRLVARLRVEGRESLAAKLQAIEAALPKAGGRLLSPPTWDGDETATDAFVRLEVSPEVNIEQVTAAWIDLDGIEVHSFGHSLEIIKDVGDARTVAARHGLLDFQGTHGLGHCRLATESAVDVAHGHPFWARPFPDVSIVHNGQITNYYKSRRLLEQEGYSFCSENDSELISVFIADRMKQGQTFAEALRYSITAMDGVFTYLLSLPEGIGMAKDRLDIKPMIVTQTDKIVAMATEEQALRQVLQQEIETMSYGPAEVVIWN